jgi:carboxymethylenebutenolidase
MKKHFMFYLFLFLTASVLNGCQSQSDNDPEDFQQSGFKMFEGIRTSDVNYISGGDTVSAFLAEPAGEGAFPALLVIHEWWGLNEVTKRDAEELAKRGYIALAVDLYRGRVASDSDEAHELMRGLPEDRAVRDLKAAYNFLHGRHNVDNDKIGSIGWCMGGSYSLQAALNIPQLKSTVICYGRLITDEELIKKINAPILGIFGEADRGIPVEDVKKFEKQLKKANKKNRIIIYPEVGHAFMNPENAGHNTETTQQAWEEIYAFFEETLK